MTGEMRGSFELLGEVGSGRVVGSLLDEVDVGEATFPELAHDAKAVLVDPNITSAVQSRKVCSTWTPR